MTTSHSPTVPDITWRQIELGVKLSLGVRNSRDDGRSLIMSVGPTRSKYEVWVTLNGYDLYDITLFKGEHQVWQRTDIFYESLNSTLLRMESENWG